MADDHKTFYAGIWRIVRSALEDNGCTMYVKKVKAHRAVEDVAADDMRLWTSNEAADKWAKLGSLDRNEEWADLAERILTGNLWKARAVVSWLGKLEWLDGRALGKVKSVVMRAEVNRQPRARAHRWSLDSPRMEVHRMWGQASPEHAGEVQGSLWHQRDQ